MKHIRDILENKASKLSNSTVNSKDKSLSTVNSDKIDSEEIDKFIEKLGIATEGTAQKLAEDLDDLESLDYYLILAKETPPGKLFKALSYTKDADRRGKIRTKKAIYFQAILKRWGIKTKFKQP